MKIDWPKPGKYILAISGGADSMVLLDLMAQSAGSKNYDLVVAHFDHGLRTDSDRDRQFVSDHAKTYGLQFVSAKGDLKDSSEETSRTARHFWLSKICQDHQAAAVITAHHENDLIETSLLNLARGSNHRGVAPMQTGPVLRPLLHVSRAELRDYAKHQKIDWREDKTNAEIDNPRNFIRHKLLPSADHSWTKSYLELVEKTAALNKEIAQNITALTKEFRQSADEYVLPRSFVKNLSLIELEEVIVSIALKLDQDIEIDRRIVSELALFIMTGKPHKRRPLRKGLSVVLHSSTAEFLKDH
jgi:tRNA(Ile)-lysidine synthase